MLSTFQALYGTGFTNWETMKLKKVGVQKDNPCRCHDMNKVHTSPLFNSREERISWVVEMNLRCCHLIRLSPSKILMLQTEKMVAEVRRGVSSSLKEGDNVTAWEEVSKQDFPF